MSDTENEEREYEEDEDEARARRSVADAMRELGEQGYAYKLAIFTSESKPSLGVPMLSGIDPSTVKSEVQLGVPKSGNLP